MNEPRNLASNSHELERQHNETDTFGKDSELAVTLAQGKPVLAYMPEIKNLKSYERKLISDFETYDSVNPVESLKKYFLSKFAKHAYSYKHLLSINNIDEIAHEITQLSKEVFDERAKQLLESHPLALQVNLTIGVAVGVIVVRNSQQCSELLYKILFRTLSFNLKELDSLHPEYAQGDSQKTYILEEKTTGSPYRVVIGDEQLTNTFWNFYNKPNNQRNT